MKPLDVACPNCQAQEGHPCTQVTPHGRRNVEWFHLAREAIIADVEPPSPAAALTATLIAALGTDSHVSLECVGCGREVDISVNVHESLVRELIEHCAFEHATREAIEVRRSSELISGYQLAVLLRLPALTEAEEKWRKESSR